MGKEKVTTYLAGITVAVSMTSLLFSLTNNPREGFDLHYADLLLPALLFTALRLHTLQRPQWLAILFSGLLLLSTTYSTKPLLTLYSATKFSLILLTFSALRRTLSTYKKEFFLPIIFISLISIPIALAQPNQAFGLSGQPNILGGHTIILLLSTSLWLTPFWAILLATTGSRAPFLGLLAALPFISRKTLIVYPILVLTLVGLYSTSQLPILSRLPTATIPTPTTSTAPTHPTILGDRPTLWADAVDRIEWLGSGYDTTTQWEETNPHNIYLQLLQELGLPLGVLAIVILLTPLTPLRPRPTPTFPMPRPQPKPTTMYSFLLLYLTSINPTLVAILIISFFDHYWLTTGQGMYLFAWALGQEGEGTEKRPKFGPPETIMQTGKGEKECQGTQLTTTENLYRNSQRTC